MKVEYSLPLVTPLSGNGETYVPLVLQASFGIICDGDPHYSGIEEVIRAKVAGSSIYWLKGTVIVA